MRLFNRAKKPSKPETPATMLMVRGLNKDGSYRYGIEVKTEAGPEFKPLRLNSVNSFATKFFRFEVAGLFAHPGAQLDCFEPGKPLVSKRNPKNACDKNAIEVRCASHDGKHFAGFIPASLEAKIAKQVSDYASWQGVALDCEIDGEMRTAMIAACALGPRIGAEIPEGMP